MTYFMSLIFIALIYILYKQIYNLLVKNQIKGQQNIQAIYSLLLTF